MRRRTALATALLLALVLAACGTDAGSPTPADDATPSPASSAGPTGSPGTAPSGSAGPGSPAPSGDFDPQAVELGLEVVVGGLDSPLVVTNAGDGSDRIFVAERTGRVRIVRDGNLVDQPFLDIVDRVLAGGEQGLLGLAFHPDYPDDPRLFVNYIDRSGTTIVSSFTAGSAPDRADPGSEVEVLRIAQPYANHNGGAVAFGPDGYLYVSTGDGGAAGDPHDNGQRLDTLLGKILRVDVDTTGGERAYAVPGDNPFVDAAGAEPEIWLTGLRNPWRMSFDRETGDLWIGDVGQGAWEEVDVARAGESGLNYGWNRLEGPDCYQDTGCEDADFTPPVAAYEHGLGCSVIGGVVYRGLAQPALAGGYVFADYCSGNVWVLDPAADGASETVLALESGRGISAIGEDEAGEAYATDLNAGELLRITATAG